MKVLALLSLLAVIGVLPPTLAQAQSSSFTYQGQLRQSGEPFTGTADLEFRLFDQLVSGSQIGSTESVSDWPVEDGLFQVELDFGATAFDGGDRFLEVTVDGAPLIPRQKITATPYALLATGLASGSVGGGSIDPSEVQLRVVGTCPAGEYIQEVNQDGSVVCGVDGTGNPGWNLSGNAGTDPATDFIGTSDNQALAFKVNGNRVLRLEPDFTSPNLIGGYSGNVVESGVEGGTIAGGGASTLENRVTGDYGTVGGGFENVASGLNATISGGLSNIASAYGTTVGGGIENTASDLQSIVGGGFNNSASGLVSTVAGGSVNTASNIFSSVGGGTGNTASGFGATVGGGQDNTASGDYSFVVGQRAKNSDASHDGVFIFADSLNDDFASTGPNQFLVRANGGVAFGRTPDDYFEIQTPFDDVSGNGAGEQGALRVRLNGATRLRLLRNGGLGVGSSFETTGVPTNGLRVLGEVRLDLVRGGGVTQLCLNGNDEISLCSSSARYKEDITPLQLGLDEVLALQPVGYRWTSDGHADIGFVAEDVAELDERLINRNNEGEIDGVRYDRLSALLANAVRTLDERDRRNDIALRELRSDNQALAERLAEIKARHGDELAELRLRQNREMDTLRSELALLREMMAPGIAGRTE